MPFPLLADQRHIQRNSESNGPFRALVDTAVAVPAGFRVGHDRKIVPGGVKEDIFTANIDALTAPLAFALIDDWRHMTAPNP
jgi:hypothetical protein